jgi:hypothetical protein
MSKAVVRCAVAAAVVVATGLLSPSAGAPAGGNLQLALDRPIDLTITDAPITQVFQRLTDAAGVKFVVGPDVYACLPYGDQTRLAVKLKNVTLRKALSPMLAPQAMEWIIEGESVRVLPTAALMRMNRRATYDELRVLGRIHSARIEPPDKAGGVLEQLRKASDDKDLSLFFHVKVADKDALFVRADRILPGTGAAWLDMLCRGQGWTWYLWGDDVMIVDSKEQIARQLQRQVSLRYEGADLVNVLLDLARKAQVKLNMDAGIIDMVPIETRKNFNLVMSDATIAQALEVITGATGLAFIRDSDGLRVEPSDRLKQKAEGSDTANKRPPFYIKKSIPLSDGSTVELLIRPEELPPEVQEALKAERAKVVEMLIQRYGATTRPAATSQPAK